MFKKTALFLCFSLIAMTHNACGSPSQNDVNSQYSIGESAEKAESTTLEEDFSLDIDSDLASDERKRNSTNGKIILATVKAVDESGLLAYLIPEFRADTGLEVEIYAVGSSGALQMGRIGDADVLITNSRSDEDKFIEDGYGTVRNDLMYNDYVVIGPANGSVSQNDNVSASFKAIFEADMPFVSRADNSEAHKKELSIWQSIGIESPEFSNYISADQGMVETLAIAREKHAYVLADRASWLSYKDKGELTVICENSEILLNQYGVIAVSASTSDDVNEEGGLEFATWISSEKAQNLISEYGIKQYGVALFTPNSRR